MIEFTIQRPIGRSSKIREKFSKVTAPGQNPGRLREKPVGVRAITTIQ